MLYHDSFSLRLPIKCIDLDNTNGQLKLEGWLHDVLIFMTLYREGAILLAISGRRYHLRLAGGWSSFLSMSKTMLEVGWDLFLWTMFYLEGWSS